MKKNLKYIITIILFFILVNNVNSQEMLGIVNSNYSGVNSTLINPSSMLNSKLFFDFNILSTDIFAYNNYAYITKDEYSFSRLLSQYIKPGNLNDIIYYNINSIDNKNAYANFRTIGPSAMFVYYDHAFSIHTSIRTIIQAENIPYNMANLLYFGMNYNKLQNFDFNNSNYNITALSWAEIGFSYAYAFYHKKNDYLSAGITINKLYSYSGAYFNFNNTKYNALNDTTLIFNNIDAEFGFSLPLDYDNNDFINKKPYIRGKGLSFNIGITYQKKLYEFSNKHTKRICEKKYQDYKYRIGISLLDIGKIKFYKNAQKHSINSASFSISNINNEGFNNINYFIKDFSYRIYNDSTQSLKSNNFSIALPSAISLQFDYRYKKNWYINSTLFCSIKINDEGQIKRPNIISVTPRYESNNFEVNLPILIYNFTKPRVGLSLRLYNFTIGTDKLGSFFSFSDFYGFDAYFSLKISLAKGKCFRFKQWQPCENNEYN